MQITRTALGTRRIRQAPHIASLLQARLAIGQARTADCAAVLGHRVSVADGVTLSAGVRDRGTAADTPTAAAGSARQEQALTPTAVRNCPHCDRPVTMVTLLAPEAVRPTIASRVPKITSLRRTP
ncbi:hypothetical protein [Streptomyces sp. NPDC012756]|uniref:hypothetical protein n=1 Tax=Streptomyces sp. NPDC012756 TaxID=3364847 RepID=UPI0036BAD134